jgi:hypothetical protein
MLSSPDARGSKGERFGLGQQANRLRKTRCSDKRPHEKRVTKLSSERGWAIRGLNPPDPTIRRGGTPRSSSNAIRVTQGRPLYDVFWPYLGISLLRKPTWHPCCSAQSRQRRKASDTRPVGTSPGAQPSTCSA